MRQKLRFPSFTDEEPGRIFLRKVQGGIQLVKAPGSQAGKEQHHVWGGGSQDSNPWAGSEHTEFQSPSGY